METNVTRRGLLWGGLLILLGALLLAQQYIVITSWVWVVVLAGAGVVAFALYITYRSELWLLLTAYILWAIALLVTLVALNVLQDEFIALYVLTAIALPFLFLFLRDQTQWWVLVPAYVLVVVGLMVAMIGIGFLTDLLIPSYIMFAIAVPFFVVFARNRAHWWALIPAGVLSIIGISFLIAEASVQYVAPIVLILIGIWMLVRVFTRKA